MDFGKHRRPYLTGGSGAIEHHPHRAIRTSAVAPAQLRTREPQSPDDHAHQAVLAHHLAARQPPVDACAGSGRLHGHMRARRPVMRHSPIQLHLRRGRRRRPGRLSPSLLLRTCTRGAPSTGRLGWQGASWWPLDQVHGCWHRTVESCSGPVEDHANPKGLASGEQCFAQTMHRAKRDLRPGLHTDACAHLPSAQRQQRWRSTQDVALNLHHPDGRASDRRFRAATAGRHSRDICAPIKQHPNRSRR
jgi:hypothetical protein